MLTRSVFALPAATRHVVIAPARRLAAMTRASRAGLLALVAGAAVLAAAASAQAATVGVLDAPSLATYRAGAGETNDLTVSFSTEGSLFSEASAELTAGDGCALTPNGVRCPAPAIDAYLRDGNDKAQIVANGAARAWAGAGNDTVSADSTTSSVAVYGEAGDDEITAGGDFDQLGDGGPGDDTIHIRGYHGRATARGGGGRDVIDLKLNDDFEVVQADLDGGGGDDTIIAQPAGRAGSAAGGDGDDVIVISGTAPADHPTGPYTVSGGIGNDTLIGGLFDDRVDAGDGRDYIDVADGGSDTVTCGAGVDVVRYDAADLIAADCEIRRPAPAGP